MRKQPTRNRQIAKYRQEKTRFIATWTRNENWCQWLTIVSMAVLLTCQACVKKLAPSQDRETPAPTAKVKTT
ncbi:hypothetical protein HER32_06790 [Hymenobacter sp. BT18]|uniref:hypothetical protein n=1 Tax=Hymenobacter sp. BT18 TaxID=2835648 RepID=UPI00143E73C8|nr:hypothetical protein [Hymenobacter sp. BT18]QIX60900.1 hypothetical protein HER32_06790 [Hymenobacter sp. BT18]